MARMDHDVKPGEPRGVSWVHASPVRARTAAPHAERWLVPGADMVAVVLAATATGLPVLASMACAVAIVAVLTWASDYRRPRVSLSAMREVPRLTSRLALMVAVAGVSLAVVRVVDDPLPALVAAAAGVVLGRFASFAALRWMRRRGLLTAPTLIIGAGSVGGELARYLDPRPECGMSILGVVDDVDRVHDLELLGGLDDLAAVIREQGARRIIITFGAARDWQLIDVIRALPADDLEILVVPRLFEVGAGSADPTTDDVGGIPLAWIDRPAVRAASQRLKRGFDLVLAVGLLVLSVPLMVAIALAVKVSSRGPVLFRQQRLGKDGKPFTLYKFRSMRVNHDSETLWSVRNDHRLTPVGRCLRRSNLDELPQLVNVLRGDMSLVGPRPERPYFVERFASTLPSYADRHRSPAGLTGWAQIHGLRGDTSIEDRVRFDNYYIDNWSMWRDLTILLRTVTAFHRHD